MRSLVVYHSLSGTTRKVAERAARALAADLAEVRTPRYARGLLGFMRAGRDSWTGRLPPIEVSGGSPEGYDFILVMGPVWVAHASTPIRAYLAQNCGKFRRLAFVLTCGNSASSRAFQEMGELAGRKPDAAFSIRERDIKNQETLPSSLAEFLSSIKLRHAA
jgi:flavodoxin